MNRNYIVEWKKIILKKTTLLLFATALLVIGYDIILSWGLQQESIYTDESNYTSLIEQIKANITRMEAEKDTGSKAQQNRTQKIIENYRWEMELYQEQLRALQEKDWREVLDGKIRNDEKALELRRKGGVVSGESQAETQRRLEMNKYLREHDIRPMVRDIDVNVWNILYQLEKSLYPFLAVFLSLFLSAACIASERRTWKFLLIQPFSRKKIICAKYCACVSVTAGFFILASVLSAVVAFSIGGAGDVRYPVPALSQAPKVIKIGQDVYMNTGDYLCLRAIYLFLLILVCSAVGLLVAVLVKNGSIAVILSIGIGCLMAATEKQMENYAVIHVYGGLAVLSIVLVLMTTGLFARKDYY